MKNKVVSLLIVTLLCIPQVSEAQCAMCRAVLQSDGNTAAAEGINNGIVYLMAIPYVAIAVLFYFVFRKMKTKTV